MRIFTCSACQQMTFFDNVACTNCGRALAYLPDHRVLSAFEPADPANEAQDPAPREDASAPLMVALAPKAKGQRYRLCQNGVEHAACNWAVPEDDPEPLCKACRLNDVIPDLGAPEALPAWRKLERGKRRLLYTLYELELPVESREERPEGGLTFSFKADGEKPEEKVFTGHANGHITININEADDPFREKVRKDMGEAYRTLLGHFRHEVGHYYWDRLIRDTPWIEHYRALFGDERVDYGESLKRHYEQGTPPDWGLSYVSAYATMHPWEDWAETWAHYLHMVDLLEIAAAYNTRVSVDPALGEATEEVIDPFEAGGVDFDDLVAQWVPLTTLVNSLNRSLGQNDAYPFALSEGALRKLQYIHDVISEVRLTGRLERQAPPAAAPAPAEAPAAT